MWRYGSVWKRIQLRLSLVSTSKPQPLTAISYLTQCPNSPTFSPAMIFFSNNQTASLTGPAGSLLLPPDDEITLKLAMLYAGDCEGLGPSQAARKFGYSPQRYFQLSPEPALGRTHHRRLRPAKRNSTRLIPKRRPRRCSRSGPRKSSARPQPIPRVWSERCGSCWPTKFPATWSVSGC